MLYISRIRLCDAYYSSAKLRLNNLYFVVLTSIDEQILMSSLSLFILEWVPYITQRKLFYSFSNTLFTLYPTVF